MSEATSVILIVDNDSVTRSALERDLAEFGVILETADGSAALTLCQHARVDLAVCSLELAGLDGATLLAQIASIQPASRRLLLSCEPPAHLALLKRKNIIHEFVAKPWELPVLRSIIGELLDRPASAPTMQRQHPRLKREMRALYGARWSGALHGGFTVDISRHGMRIRGSTAPQVGSEIEVVVIPHLGPGASGTARVIWSASPGAPGDFGVRLLSFDAPDAAATYQAWTAAS